jgi:hypothetical protein
MGAEMTKWMIDSKVEDLHKKMPWRDDDEGEKGQQQAADSIVDEFGQMFGQRTEEECEQGTRPQSCAECPLIRALAHRLTFTIARTERKETEAALKKSRKVAASLRSKYKLGSGEKQTKTYVRYTPRAWRDWRRQADA